MLRTEHGTGSFLKNLSRGLLLIVGSQIWECCAYFGLRAMLVLFLTSHVGYSDNKAFGLYLTMVAMADALSVLGGRIGDTYGGTARTPILGSLLMLAGFILINIPVSSSEVVLEIWGQVLAYSDYTLHLGSAFVSVGVALYRPNCFTLIGTKMQYDANKAMGNNPMAVKARIDSGMALAYGLIDVGFIMAYLLIGFLAENWGWYIAITATSISMAIGSAFLCAYQIRALRGKFLGWFFNAKLLKTSILVIPLILLCYLSVINMLASHMIVAACIIATLAYAVKQFKLMLPEEKERALAFVAYLFMLVLFIAIERQIYTVFPLFFSRNVIRDFWNWTVPVSALYVTMPLAVLILGPLSAYFIHHWRSNSLLPGIRCIIAFACFTVTHVFLLLGCAAANSNGMTSIMWPVSAIVVFAIADAIFIPSILAMATRLSPPNMRGVFNGMVFVWVAFGTLLAKPLSSIMAIADNKNVDTVASLQIYEAGFTKITAICLFCTVAAIMVKWRIDLRINTETHGATSTVGNETLV